MRRVTVRKSSVPWQGVFALQPVPTGRRIFEYRGEVTSWRRASARHERFRAPGYTFIFALADGRVIDGSAGGNGTRWLNHSCQPNCETIEGERGRVLIETLKDLTPGDKLFIAYGLTIHEVITPELATDLFMPLRNKAVYWFDAGVGALVTGLFWRIHPGISLSQETRQPHHDGVSALIRRAQPAAVAG